VYFCTQDPSDVPEGVLGQLGLKVQHALRAFTAKDRTTIKRTAENYPLTDFYDTEELLTSLGIGEAIVSALSEKGTPTPLAHTLMRAPATRMDVLTPLELDGLVARSALAGKYNEEIDRDSAFEILENRLKGEEGKEVPKPAPKERGKPEPKERSVIEDLSKNTMVRQVGNTLMRELTRGLLGVLGVKPRRR
jgi:DNA helicase HerA-like ATPase